MIAWHKAAWDEYLYGHKHDKKILIGGNIWEPIFGNITHLIKKIQEKH